MMGSVVQLFVGQAHVIVDRLPADPSGKYGLIVAVAGLLVAVITFVAVGIQIYLARRALELADQTLKKTGEELELAKNQLVEAQNATTATRQTLKLTSEQIELARADAIDRQAQLAPRLIAEMQFDQSRQRYDLHVTNKGAIAQRVTVFGMSPDGTVSSAADNFFQVVAPGEQHKTKFGFGIGGDQYVRKVRIRGEDAFGNKYMTEYESLGTTLTWPIFRTPWLGRTYGAPPPKRSSEFVSWELSPLERIIGVPDELLDPIPLDDQGQ